MRSIGLRGGQNITKSFSKICQNQSMGLVVVNTLSCFEHLVSKN